jgi:hypothetical protein
MLPSLPNRLNSKDNASNSNYGLSYTIGRFELIAPPLLHGKQYENIEKLKIYSESVFETSKSNNISNFRIDPGVCQ